LAQTLEFLQRLEWEGEQQWKGYMDKYIEACAQAQQYASDGTSSILLSLPFLFFNEANRGCNVEQAFNSLMPDPEYRTR
jgi:hypothetical protein